MATRSDLKGMKEPEDQWEACLRKIAQEQDMAAFEKFYEHFGPQIKSFAYKLAAMQSNESLADELVQESMLKVWSKAHTFNPEKASVNTWLFTIARNTRIDLLRKYDRHTRNRVAPDTGENGFDIDDIWVESDEPQPFDLLARQRLKQTMKQYLNEIPAEQSFILKKIYMEGKSHTTVAEELELPLGTVKSRVRLGLKKLGLSLSKQIV